MGASEEAFRIMLSTPSDRVRYLTIVEFELSVFGGLILLGMNSTMQQWSNGTVLPGGGL